jgi:hypothetical protein
MHPGQLTEIGNGAEFIILIDDYGDGMSILLINKKENK